MAGDHQCPLCSATFTRPQHVGRHLRAHTGDRPYECKECPLKFARSDLLSRHVNKAHRPPGEGGKPNEKKSAGPNTKAARRQSLPGAIAKKDMAPPKPITATPRDKPRSASLSQPTLQAQKIYPHHPLLAGSAQPQTAQMPNWNPNPGQPPFPMAAVGEPPHIPLAPGFVNPAKGTGDPNAILGNPNAAYANIAPPFFEPSYTATPMNVTESDQTGLLSGNKNPTFNGVTYEWGVKKRACDQCNHSKVRCDFADPCLRCTHRNIQCSYTKPQRAKTISYQQIPGQGQSYPMGMAAPSATSGSPQSRLSSPHAGSSPINVQNPVAHRKPSTASLPPNPTGPTVNPALVANPMPWNSYPQVGGTHLPTSSWQPAQTQPMQTNHYLSANIASNITNQISESPGLMPAPLPPVGSRLSLPGARSQGSSPQNNMAPTPGLTSVTTSPSDIDEPAERRSSFNSVTGTFASPPTWSTTAQRKKLAPTLQTHNSDPIAGIPSGISPTSINSSSHMPMPGADLIADQQTAFLPPDQWHGRLSFSTDDGDSSALSSSANSTYVNLNDAQSGFGQHHRRRSSAGTWANAMAQMSLQDPHQNGESSTIPLPEPYVSSSDNPTNHVRPVRPTFPTLSGIGEDAEPTAIPSLSDVKDLWRLFMADPAATPTPAVEMPAEVESTVPPATARPGLGKRTLSKSNSMPDLQSPLVNGPAFFANFLNGMTPKPTEAQQSYIPPHQMQQAAAVSTDNPDVGQWSKEIQQRQSSFNLKSQPGSKMSKSPGMSQEATMSSSHSMLPPTAKTLRPLPSVVQRSSALQQTLAPERVPSFNLTPSFGLDTQLPTLAHPTQPQTSGYNSVRQQKSLAPRPQHQGPSSVDARPGNKRLASQTLIGDGGKRASFSLFDEDGAFAPIPIPTSVGQHPSTGLGYDPAPSSSMGSQQMYEPSMFSSPPQSSYIQPQQLQQKWTGMFPPSPSASPSASALAPVHHTQSQNIPTQSTSMFYPNWALPTEPSTEAHPMSL